MKRCLINLGLLLSLIIPVTAQAGYRVQSGITTMGDLITTRDVALNVNVSNLDKAFVIIHYFYAHQPGINGSVDQNDGMVNAYLWDDVGTTKIRFTRHAGAVAIHISWTVIECTDDEFTVYRGSQSWSGTTTLYTPAIGATVVGDNCFAWVNGTTCDQANRLRVREAHFTADVSSGSQTTLNLRRFQVESSPSGTLRWIVVEFDPTKIGGLDTGEETITTQLENSRASWLISGCVKSRSLLLGQWRVSGDDGLNAHSIALHMADDTTGQAYVHLSNDYNRVLRWYCIDFGPNVGSRQEGQVDNSGNPGWTTADQTISPAVDTTRAVSFVTLTCDGNGTLFPRPMIRHWLSSGNTLEIERNYYGQGSWIEWQVLELPPISQRPILNPIGSKSVDEGQTLEFRISASDPDLDSIILSAENVPTNATFTDSGNGAGSFTFNPDYTQSDTYYVTFIASDGSLADSEVVDIEVNDVNRAPVSNAGSDQSGIEANTLVSLDGSGSSDPDGDSLGYHWSQISGPSVTLSDTNIVNPTFTPTVKGNYEFELLVDDGVLISSPDTILISVNNQGPVADAGSDQLGIEVNTLVILDGSGSYDLDGDSLGYHWSQISGPPVTLSDTNKYYITFTPTIKGNYEFELLVDDGALVSSPDTVLVSVDNQAPLADAGADQSGVEANTLVTLDGSGSSDPDGDSLGYHWSQVSGPSVTLSDTNILNPTFTPTVKGNYEFELLVDDGALTSSPDTVLIQVNNQTPVADAGADQSGIEANTLVTLDGSGSYDPDGDSLGYHWAQVSGPSVTLSDTNIVDPTFTPTVKGNYEFELLVDDGALVSSPDTVLVSVDNQAPVADAGADQLGIEANTLVTLDGSGSSDPDGDSLGYHWSQISGPSVSLSDSNIVNPTLTPIIKGNYEFELLVDDSYLLSSSLVSDIRAFGDVIRYQHS
ncbi:MAG: hypothetical protein AMJ90_04835 [candidate division Zixibacteria bacterium SM23_73_2]|nr:MAG: hypothetical protein AMJ90_04835 [candidate division Zixibacteria bacterium SM23_73_2]